jgi:hypothetical protein
MSALFSGGFMRCKGKKAKAREAPIFDFRAYYKARGLAGFFTKGEQQILFYFLSCLLRRSPLLEVHESNYYGTYYRLSFSVFRKICPITETYFCALLCRLREKKLWTDDGYVFIFDTVDYKKSVYMNVTYYSFYNLFLGDDSFFKGFFMACGFSKLEAVVLSRYFKRKAEREPRGTLFEVDGLYNGSNTLCDSRFTDIVKQACLYMREKQAAFVHYTGYKEIETVGIYSGLHNRIPLYEGKDNKYNQRILSYRKVFSHITKEGGFRKSKRGISGACHVLSQIYKGTYKLDVAYCEEILGSYTVLSEFTAGIDIKKVYKYIKSLAGDYDRLCQFVEHCISNYADFILEGKGSPESIKYMFPANINDFFSGQLRIYVDGKPFRYLKFPFFILFLYDIEPSRECIPNARLKFHYLIGRDKEAEKIIIPCIYNYVSKIGIDSQCILFTHLLKLQRFVIKYKIDTLDFFRNVLCQVYQYGADKNNNHINADFFNPEGKVLNGLWRYMNESRVYEDVYIDWADTGKKDMFYFGY